MIVCLNKLYTIIKYLQFYKMMQHTGNTKRHKKQLTIFQLRNGTKCLKTYINSTKTQIIWSSFLFPLPTFSIHQNGIMLAGTEFNTLHLQVKPHQEEQSHLQQHKGYLRSLPQLDSVHYHLLDTLALYL